MTGFHGEAEGTPGEEEVSQAAFYVKRNPNIPGMNEATTWEYDTDVIDAVNALFDPALGLNFEGAQLVDSQGLCLTRPENSIDDHFVVYVDDCVEFDGDIEDGANIAAIKRQTWIIENT